MKAFKFNYKNSYFRYSIYCIAILAILCSIKYDAAYQAALKTNTDLHIQIDSLQLKKDLRKNIRSKSVKTEIFEFEVLGLTKEEKLKMMNNVLFLDRYIPLMNQHFGTINMNFNTEIKLFKYKNLYFDHLTYSIPSLVKNDSKSKVKKTSDSHFEFTPTSPGMYYWSGAFVYVNSKTGKRTEFSIYDSIYVFP